MISCPLPTTLLPQKIVDPQQEITYCLQSFDHIMKDSIRNTNFDYPMLYYIIYHLTVSSPISHAQTLIEQTKSYLTFFVKELGISKMDYSHPSFIKDYLISYNRFHKGIIKINKISRYLNRIAGVSLYDIGIRTWKEVIFNFNFLEEISQLCLGKFESLRKEKGLDDNFVVFLSSLEMVDPLYYRETLVKRNLLPQMLQFYLQTFPTTFTSFNEFQTEISQILNWEQKWRIKGFKEQISKIVLNRKEAIIKCLERDDVLMEDLNTFYLTFGQDRLVMDEIILYSISKIDPSQPFWVIVKSYSVRRAVITKHMGGDEYLLQSLKESFSRSLSGLHQKLAEEMDFKIQKLQYSFDAEFYILHLFTPKAQLQFLEDYFVFLRKRILLRGANDNFMIEDQLIRKFPIVISSSSLSSSSSDENNNNGNGKVEEEETAELLMTTRDILVKMKRLIEDKLFSSSFVKRNLDPLISVEHQWSTTTGDNVEGEDDFIPKKIKDSMKAVEKDYKKKYPKRSLKWISSLNRILVSLQNGSEIWMNLAQYRILEKFSSNDSIPSNIEGGEALESLIINKILLKDGESLVVNTEYKGIEDENGEITDISDIKSQSLLLSPPNTESPILSGVIGANVGSGVTEEKKIIIQSVIMNILKKETKLSPQALYNIIVEGSQSPETMISKTVFKEIMAGLEEKEFVEYIVNQNSYQYIP